MGPQKEPSLSHRRRDFRDLFAIATSVADDAPLALARYEAWLLDARPGSPLQPTLTPYGRAAMALCDARFLVRLMRSLAGQDWLDRLPRASVPDKSERLVALLSETGDLWSAQPAPRSSLPLRLVLNELRFLKIAWTLLGAVRMQRWSAARQQLQVLGPTVMKGLAQIEAAEPRQERALPMTVALVIAHQLEGCWGQDLAEGHGDIPFRLPHRPRTPAQYAWASLAISAGAVLPYQDIPGIDVCDYPPCRRIFARPPRPTRGQQTFCSKPCGDRFWARKATQASRAAKRAPCQQPKQED